MMKAERVKLICVAAVGLALFLVWVIVAKACVATRPTTKTTASNL